MSTMTGAANASGATGTAGLGSGGGSGGGPGGQVADITITGELDEILRRITDIKNIAGVVVVNSEGVTVKSTLDNSLTALYSVLVSSLAKRAKSIVRDLDPTNELTYLRIKSKKHEVLVAPDQDYMLIVVQNPPDPLPQ